MRAEISKKYQAEVVHQRVGNMGFLPESQFVINFNRLRDDGGKDYVTVFLHEGIGLFELKKDATKHTSKVWFSKKDNSDNWVEAYEPLCNEIQRKINEIIPISQVRRLQTCTAEINDPKLINRIEEIFEHMESLIPAPTLGNR